MTGIRWSLSRLVHSEVCDEVELVEAVCSVVRLCGDNGRLMFLVVVVVVVVVFELVLVDDDEDDDGCTVESIVGSVISRRSFLLGVCSCDVSFEVVVVIFCLVVSGGQSV